MSGFRDNRKEPDRTRYRPADARTRDEVGGILERSFQHESGREPNEEEARRLLALADEAEKRAEVAESLAREAEAAVVDAVEVCPQTGEAASLEETAERRHREAEVLRAEADRLRRYLP
jgi:hypothetical protein